MGPDPGLGPWKTWMLKHLDPEKPGKQLGTEKRLQDYIIKFINTENLLRRDLQASHLKKQSLRKTENVLKNKNKFKSNK